MEWTYPLCLRPMALRAFETARSYAICIKEVAALVLKHGDLYDIMHEKFDDPTPASARYDIEAPGQIDIKKIGHLELCAYLNAWYGDESVKKHRVFKEDPGGLKRVIESMLQGRKLNATVAPCQKLITVYSRRGERCGVLASW